MAITKASNPSRCAQEATKPRAFPSAARPTRFFVIAIMAALPLMRHTVVDPRQDLRWPHLVGFGQMAAMFLTSSATAVMVLAVMPAPAREDVNWITWLAGSPGRHARCRGGIDCPAACIHDAVGRH
jgi:hypothetical protein